MPPSESLPIARRVGYAYTYVARGNKPPLYFIDLNATSPGLAEKTEEVFARPGMSGTGVRFVDGAILGGPPELIEGQWRKPRIVVSGPERLVGEAGQRLEEALGLRWVGERVGQASGLKMCFASLTKVSFLEPYLDKPYARIKLNGFNLHIGTHRSRRSVLHDRL